MATGIFDSGLGGLSVYKEFKKKFPNEKVIYFADNINFPYGLKTTEQIIKFSENIVDFLLSKGVSRIIIACNTATCASYEHLIKKYKVEIYSIVNPVCEYILENNINEICLIATKSTINSKIYDVKLDNRIVNKIIATDLVDYAENMNFTNVDFSIKNYFSDVKAKNVLLGCTHFPLLENNFKKLNINLINPAKYLADKISIECSDNGNDIFYITKDNDFKDKAKKILGRSDIDVRIHKW